MNTQQTMPPARAVLLDVFKSIDDTRLQLSSSILSPFRGYYKNDTAIITANPYYTVYRHVRVDTSHVDKFFMMQDKVRYHYSKKELKTMTQERDLIPYKKNGTKNKTWVSDANRWEFSNRLNADFMYRQQYAPLIYLVLRKQGLPYELIEIIVGHVFTAKRQSLHFSSLLDASVA
jgi:hypothetical protein